MYQNPFLNPYGAYPQQYQQMAQAQPQQQVVKVNGENGARAYQIGANSSALLLDETGTMVWLCTTDGAGYKTVSAYDIIPHQPTPPPDFSNFEARISRLEEIVNGKHTDAVSKKQSDARADKADDVSGKNGTKSSTAA